jgi:hypothetical protein
MLDPECRARCAVRGTRAARAERFDWSVTVRGAHPVAAGRAGELAEPRALRRTTDKLRADMAALEAAIGAYDRPLSAREVTRATHTRLSRVLRLDRPQGPACERSLAASVLPSRDVERPLKALPATALSKSVKNTKAMTWTAIREDQRVPLEENSGDGSRTVG